MDDELLKNLEPSLEKAFVNYEHNLNKVRAEGANPNLLDSITINYYGNFTPLTQLSNIIKKDANLLLIKPFDKGIIKEIYSAINKSELELSPTIDGEQIRIFIPPLTEEKRKHFVKMAKEIMEESKINFRNIRHEFIKKIQNDEELTEDQQKWLTDQVQTQIDKYNKLIENRYKEKSEKLMVI